jgi:hypothetical protein
MDRRHEKKIKNKKNPNKNRQRRMLISAYLAGNEDAISGG